MCLSFDIVKTGRHRLCQKSHGLVFNIFMRSFFVFNFFGVAFDFMYIIWHNKIHDSWKSIIEFSKCLTLWVMSSSEISNIVTNHIKDPRVCHIPRLKMAKPSLFLLLIISGNIFFVHVGGQRGECSSKDKLWCWDKESLLMASRETVLHSHNGARKPTMRV